MSEYTDLEKFDIALRIAGFNFEKKHIELFLHLYNLIVHNVNPTLKDVTDIVASNKTKYEEKK